MKTNTIAKADKLKTLAGTIRKTHDSAVKLADESRKTANRAIAEALLCGQALIEAKSLLGHGNWLSWLKGHCPDVSHDTASRYMRLAKNAHVRNLEDCASLRQAYIDAGIIPSPKPIAQVSIVTEALTAYAEAGKALREIRDERLYRAAGHDTFESFVNAQWGFSKGDVCQLIDDSVTGAADGFRLP